MTALPLPFGVGDTFNEAGRVRSPAGSFSFAPVASTSRQGAVEPTVTLRAPSVSSTRARAAGCDPSVVPGGFRDVSTDEYLRGLGLSPAEEELDRVFWGLYNHCPSDEASHTWFLHIMATYGITWQQMSEVTAYY